ncbi:MAG TPA: hypothetical protein PLF13_06695 [candidate division Zixibacteria bacterium]|nr:hypothetical protein [candidate division Zixibacteria bacterium]
MRALVLLFAVLAVSSAWADVPQVMTYQGRLTDADGAPINDTVQILFVIYEDPGAVEKMWNELHSEVPVVDGMFNVMLGSSIPIYPSVFDGSTRYLRLSIDGTYVDSLIPLVTVPNAFKSLRADTAQYAVMAAGVTDDNWTKSGHRVSLTDNSDSLAIGTHVPLQKFHVQGNIFIPSGAAVKLGSSLNEIRGYGTEVVLAAEQDIFIEPGGYLSITDAHDIERLRFLPNSLKLGLGTIDPEDMLHLQNSNANGTAFLKLQTSNASAWGETGIRIETPENRWHWRMDDYTNNNLPDGALGLRSQNLGAEVMVWTLDGKIGIGTTSPAQKLHVVGNAAVSGKIGVGTDNPVQTLDVNGNADVSGTLSAGLFSGNFEANAISSANISNEPGLSSASSTSWTGLSTSWTSYLQRQITVPAAGWVMAIGQASVYFDHGVTGRSGFSLAISDVPDAASGMESSFGLDGALGSGVYFFTVGAQQVFYCPSAGTYTYYMVAQRDADNPASIYDRYLNLIYLPTSYSSSSAEMTEALGGSAATDRAIKEEIIRSHRQPHAAAVLNTDVTKQISDLSAELERLKQRLAELESK